MSELGRVLCGPILRRVTGSEVNVFLILDGSASVRLQIGDSPPSAPVRTVRIGDRAHAVLASASVALERGRTHRYDVHVQFDGEIGSLKLQDLELLGPEGIGYEDGALPTFSLPTGRQEVRICHGSCRLPHGDGQDMLPLADGLIRRARGTPGFAGERPHHLLLTGDQIYADDVHPPMLAAAREVAAMLGIRADEAITGRRERIAFAQGASPAPAVGFTRSQFVELGDPRVKPIEEAVLRALPPARTRGEFIRSNLEITSSHSDCHLMFFGEYAAMYMLVWSDALWNPTGIAAARQNWEAWSQQEKEALLDLFMNRSLPESAASWWAEDLKRAAAFEQEALDGIGSVLDFVGTLGAVRRLLANIPVSTIFDDHEVTDDWNLNGAWMRNARASAGTRQVIRNALTAYAVFQDWGNRPGDYREGELGRDILDYAAAPDEQQRRLLEGLFWLDDDSSPIRKEWSHVVPGPGYQILFLDARTHRVPAQEPNGAIQLVSQASLDSQFGGLDRSGSDRIIVVAGTPVFGVHVLEMGQNVLGLHPVTAANWDFESWSANETGCLALVESMARFGSVTVLSGDVHYSFANDVRLSEWRSPGRSLQIAQFCCSALKNYMDAGALEAVYRALSDPRLDPDFLLRNIPFPDLRAELAKGLDRLRSQLRPDYSGVLTSDRDSRARLAQILSDLLTRLATAFPTDGAQLAQAMHCIAAAIADPYSRIDLQTLIDTDEQLHAEIQALLSAGLPDRGWRFDSQPAPISFGLAALNPELLLPGPAIGIREGYYVCAQAVLGVVRFEAEGQAETVTQQLFFRVPNIPSVLGQLRAEIRLDPASAG